jgi:hypothetical protein
MRSDEYKPSSTPGTQRRPCRRTWAAYALRCYPNKIFPRRSSRSTGDTAGRELATTCRQSAEPGPGAALSSPARAHNTWTWMASETPGTWAKELRRTRRPGTRDLGGVQLGMPKFTAGRRAPAATPRNPWSWSPSIPPLLIQCWSWAPMAAMMESISTSGTEDLVDVAPWFCPRPIHKLQQHHSSVGDMDLCEELTELGKGVT